MPCKNITNNSNLDLKQHQNLFDDFFPYSQEKLGYDKPFSLNLTSDEENHKNPLGKTAHYDPSSYEVTIYTDGRHIKDILRSLSHELVHHAQNCRGEFGKGLDTRAGYAQEDGHLRNMEKEAYLEGNLLFRDWEDQKKQKTGVKKMKSTRLKEMIRRELKKVLSELTAAPKYGVAGGQVGPPVPTRTSRRRSPKLALMQAKLNLALQGAANEGKKVTRVEIPVDGLQGPKTRQAIRDIRALVPTRTSIAAAMHMFGSKVTPNPNRHAAKAVMDLFGGKQLASFDTAMAAVEPKKPGLYDEPRTKAATAAEAPGPTADVTGQAQTIEPASPEVQSLESAREKCKAACEEFDMECQMKCVNLQEGVQSSKKLPMYKMRDDKVFKLLIKESVK